MDLFITALIHRLSTPVSILTLERSSIDSLTRAELGQSFRGVAPSLLAMDDALREIVEILKSLNHCRSLLARTDSLPVISYAELLSYFGSSCDSKHVTGIKIACSIAILQQIQIIISHLCLGEPRVEIDEGSGVVKIKIGALLSTSYDSCSSSESFVELFLVRNRSDLFESISIDAALIAFGAKVAIHINQSRLEIELSLKVVDDCQSVSCR